MRKSPLLAALVLVACEEVPTTPPGQVCYPLSASTPADTVEYCDAQACAPKAIALHTSAPTDVFECGVGSCAKASLSDDVAAAGSLNVQLTRADLTVQLVFALAVLDQPISLATLRQNLVSYQVSTWKLGLFPSEPNTSGWVIDDAQLTLDAFSSGVLTFHVAGHQRGLSYVAENTVPHLCPGGGTLPTLCTRADCSYAVSDPSQPAIALTVDGTAQLTALVP